MESDSFRERDKEAEKGMAIEPERQICVYIDPVTPAPFAECIKNGVKQWGKAFEAAGWRMSFVLVRT